MYAADSLTDALHLTKRYLSALWLRGWLKLGVVLAFLGGFGVFLQVFNVPAELGVQALEGSDELLLVAAGAAVVLAIYVAFRYVAALLEFVFVESLRSETMSVRHYLRTNLRRGLSLLVFRFAVGIGAIAAVAVSVAAIVVLGDVSDPSELSDGAVAAFVGYAVLVLLGWFAVDTLTNGFVVPIMLHDERGPISAWRRFAPVIGTNWVGVLAFLLVAWALGFALWAVFAVVGFFAAFFGLFLWILFAALLTAVHDSLVLVAVVGLLVGYLAYQYAVALVESPVRSYVRYYAIGILGATDDSLDLVADRRVAITAGTGSSADPGPMRPTSDLERADHPTDVEGPGVEPTTGDVPGESGDRAFDDPVWEGESAWGLPTESRADDGDAASRTSDDASEPLDSSDGADGTASSDDETDGDRSEADDRADEEADDSN